jgi:hypothetical protein
MKKQLIDDIVRKLDNIRSVHGDLDVLFNQSVISLNRFKVNDMLFAISQEVREITALFQTFADMATITYRKNDTQIISNDS